LQNVQNKVTYNKKNIVNILIKGVLIMFETLDKVAMAGLGALTMTREKAEKIFDEYVKRGEIEKDSRKGFMKDVMDSAEKTRKDLEKMISDEVKKTIDSMDIATKKDIRHIEGKLDKVLKGK